MIKIVAIIGFIIFGVIVDCGGVPTDTRGYIGAHYWHQPGAFRNGFKGFCSVFVNAAFAYAGTELVGLAAAEAEDPRKSLPKATKQGKSPLTLLFSFSRLEIPLHLLLVDRLALLATKIGALIYFHSILAYRNLLRSFPLHRRSNRPLRLGRTPRRS